MGALYVLGVATVLVAIALGYLVAFIAPGRPVEIGAVCFLLGIAYAENVHPWVCRKIDELR